VTRNHCGILSADLFFRLFPPTRTPGFCPIAAERLRARRRPYFKGRGCRPCAVLVTSHTMASSCLRKSALSARITQGRVGARFRLATYAWVADFVVALVAPAFPL